MTNYYTENLSDFGIREIILLRDLLDAWINKGLPENFYQSGVKPAFNRNSGHVFLVNEDYQVAMLNGEDLEIFHSLPYCGGEGFLSELMADYNPSDLNADDIEYVLTEAEANGYDLPPPWLDYKIDYIVDDTLSN